MKYNKIEDRAELISIIQALEKRLKHLLASDFIASFDEVNLRTGEYIRDIHEADKIANKAIANKTGIKLAITKGDLRPCKVNGENALFHRWENYKNVVEASPLVGGHPAGQISYTLGIVELEDGSIIKVLPEKIRFCPGIHREYSFFMPED